MESNNTQPTKEIMEEPKKNCKLCCGSGRVNSIDPTNYRLGHRHMTKKRCQCVKVWERDIIV